MFVVKMRRKEQKCGYGTMDDNEKGYEQLCQRLREGDPSLTEVVVSRNVDSVFVDALANNSCTLTTISLENCPGFGDKVAAVVASMPAVTKIRLRNAGLTATDARRLASSINFRNLQLLDLQDNPKLGPRGIQPLAEKFSLIAKQLDEINLSNCRMGHFGAKALENNGLPACLRALDLSRNGIGNDGAWKLAPVLKGLSSLQSLFVGKNQISDDGASAIGRQFPSSLKILDMSDNDVADVGAQVISRAIIDSRLEKVVLANNKIGDSGATALSQAVAQSSFLYELDLTGNEIGDEGATSLAKGLLPTFDGDESARKSSSLAILCLRDNRIGDEGAGSFVEHLDQNRELVTLNLYENDGITAARRNILEMLLKHRKSRRPVENEIDSPPTSPVRQSNDKEMILLEGRRLLHQIGIKLDAVEISPSYLEICSDNFNIQGVVSHGAFGELFNGSDSGRSYIIRKVVLGETGDVVEARARALRELVELRHDNFLPLKAYATDNGFYYFAYESVGLTSLDQCIGENVRRKQMTWRVRLGIMRGVANALDYLHTGGHGRRSTFHGDIKSENIFVTSNYISQVMDCGVLQLVSTDGARFQRRDVVFGSQGYRCPRYERGSRKYSHESDIFSLGIVIMELCTGRIQNHTDASTGLRQDFYYEYVVDKKRDLAKNIDSSAGKWNTRAIATLCKIAIACVNGEPMLRPGASSIVKMLGDIEKISLNKNHL